MKIIFGKKKEDTTKLEQKITELTKCNVELNSECASLKCRIEALQHTIVRYEKIISNNIPQLSIKSETETLHKDDLKLDVLQNNSIEELNGEDNNQSLSDISQQLSEHLEELTTIFDDIDDLKSIEEDIYSDMPERTQESARGKKISVNIEVLSLVFSSLDESICSIEEAISKFKN